MTQETKPAVPDRSERYPFFKGYPYLVVRISQAFHHINLLSQEQNSFEDLEKLAQAQADANKLEACLVLGEKSGGYFSSKHGPHFSEQIPMGGIFITNQLRLSVKQPLTEEISSRKAELYAFIQRTGPKTGYLMGDIQKGGREANYEELICLRGVQENGLPKGLVVCPVCGKHRGLCLDPSEQLRGLVVRVSCDCDNDALCAHCGGKLHERKPNSNHYNPRDGHLWHTPSFMALSHRCSGT